MKAVIVALASIDLTASSAERKFPALIPALPRIRFAVWDPGWRRVSR